MRRTADYVPRKEPPSWTAGAKVVKVDRVEWIAMPDAQTAVNALQSGDIDFLENVPFDLVRRLAANKRLEGRNPGQARLPDHRTNEFPLSALRQRQGPPRGVPGAESEGRAGRAGRQPGILSGFAARSSAATHRSPPISVRNRWCKATAWRRRRSCWPNPATTARPS